MSNMNEIEKKYFGAKKKHWVEDQFFRVRVDALKKQLNPKNSESFSKMDFQRQKRIIAHMIDKGLMF